MRMVFVFTLIAALITAPLQALAEHGRGGGGSGSGGGGGGNTTGGWRGGGGGGALGAGGGAPRGAGFQGHGATHAATPVRPIASGGPGHAQFNHVANHSPQFNNRPMYHGNWYHGDWHGHAGGPWGYRPYGWGWGGGWGGGWGLGLGFGLGVGVGMGAMALGSPWGWGYYSYYNPYWTGPYAGATYINYSQPVVLSQPVVAQPVVQAQQPAAPAGYNAPGYNPAGYNAGGYNPYGAQSAPPAPALDPAQQARQDDALQIFDNARSLFGRGDYKNALAQADRAIKLVPNDSVMHEFRALCLFALQDYQQSAAAVYAVVSVGPGWDWTTVNNLYPNVDVYAQQLAALEKYATDHPNVPGPRFLLGYHYLLAGHNDQAAAQFEQVVELQPKDQLAAQLLKGLTTRGDVPQPGPPAEPAKPVDAASVVGSWKSSRPDGSTFEMSLGADNKFSWKFNQQDKQQAMNGTYTLADNYLILKASDQNALVGQVELAANNQLKFKLAGGNPADPGLTFTR